MPRIRSNVFRQSRSLMVYSPSSGKVVPDQNSAARPRRQPFDVLVLRQIRPHAVHRRARGDVEVAHRQPADVPRRRQVTLHQRRRDRQDVRDVVEPAALIVGRQQRGRVDVQGQQIADRVGVLGPVQTMDGGPPGTWPLGRRPIQRGFKVSRPGRRVGLVPAAACRAAASSRRAASGSLFPRSPRLGERPSGRRVRATARPCDSCRCDT